MAIQAHLQSLSRRHEALDAALSNEMKRVGADDTRLHELKRQKLKLKDQIEQIKRQVKQGV
ncbi:MAG: DUF465 domain-containing protein [Pseudomonadota bacterium]